MGETDPREEIVEKALFEAMHIYKWPATPDMWRARARFILAALDAARPVEPPCAPPKIDTSISIETRAALDELDGHTKKAAAVAPTILVGSSARPAEPLQEYDAADAIDRAIRNWSTISDEPPVDEEVAGLVERLLAVVPTVYDAHEAAAIIERQQAEIARLREALEPFAEYAEGIDLWDDDASVDAQVTAGDLRRARTALDAIKEDRT